MSWFIGQSIVMIALAFLLGLAVGWLLWYRRYRRLEEAAAARLADPATVLPHHGSGSPVRPVAAPVAAAPVVAAPVVAAEADRAALEDEGEDFLAEPDVVAEAEPDRVEASDGAAAPAEDVAFTDVEVEDDRAPEVPEQATAAGLDDDLVQSQPQSLLDAAGQPEPVAVGGAGAGRGQADRLERIEGIGPKIALALRVAGIDSFERLANANEATVRDALADANLRFAPSLSTWAQQARLLADGDDEGHAALTAQLVAGRAPRTQR